MTHNCVSLLLSMINFHLQPGATNAGRSSQGITAHVYLPTCIWTLGWISPSVNAFTCLCVSAHSEPSEGSPDRQHAVQWLGVMPRLVSKSLSSRATRYIHFSACAYQMRVSRSPSSTGQLEGSESAEAGAARRNRR